MVKNSASGGTKWVDVAPERFPGWVASFARRHGTGGEDQSLMVAMTGETVIFTAPDGAVAECHPPFPPLADNSKKRAAAKPGAAPEPGVVVEPGHLHVIFPGRRNCWASSTNLPRLPAMISKGSAQRRGYAAGLMVAGSPVRGPNKA